MTPKNLFLSGSPGVGKTTLLKEATLPYRASIGGFITEQVMERRARVGFRIKTFGGESADLASKRLPGPPKLGKYGVDLEALERVGVASLEKARLEGRVVVIDEVGAMEALSERFREEVLACLQAPVPVLGTVRKGTHDFADSVKRMSGTRVLALTRGTYDAVKKEVREWLESKVGE